MGDRSAPVVILMTVLLAAGCGGDTSTADDPEPSTSSPTPSETVSEAPSETPTEPELLGSTTVAAEKPPAGATVIEMTGPPPQLRPRELTARAGRRTVFFIDNTSPDGDSHGGHVLAIGRELDQPVAVSDLVAAADSATFTVRGLEPGTYAIWCDYLEHASLGQRGTLTVK